VNERSLDKFLFVCEWTVTWQVPGCLSMNGHLTSPCLFVNERSLDKSLVACKWTRSFPNKQGLFKWPFTHKQTGTCQVTVHSQTNRICQVTVHSQTTRDLSSDRSFTNNQELVKWPFIQTQNSVLLLKQTYILNCQRERQ
jgi:hypothetical protein